MVPDFLWNARPENRYKQESIRLRLANYIADRYHNWGPNTEANNHA